MIHFTWAIAAFCFGFLIHPSIERQAEKLGRYIGQKAWEGYKRKDSEGK